MPRTHQFLVTLTVHTNKINPAPTAPATSAPSMTNEYPAVVILRDGQQVALGNAADTFEANAAVTPESIEDFARRLQAVAANQDAAIASANARFTF